MSTSEPRAPIAMRMPISRVRSVTDTSMMFMIPMPPTISDTDAIAASSHVMIFVVPVRRVRDLRLIAHGEVVVVAVGIRCDSRMIARDLVLRRRNVAAATIALTRIWPMRVLPLSRALRRRVRDEHDVVLILRRPRSVPSARARRRR